jgi:hypothetical protein
MAVISFDFFIDGLLARYEPAVLALDCESTRHAERDNPFAPSTGQTRKPDLGALRRE